MKRFSTSCLGFVALFALGSALNASPILGDQLFTLPGGARVQVDVLRSSSGFSNPIGLYEETSPGVFDLVQPIGIDNQIDTVDLGIFPGGQELIFGIQSPQGLFLMGPGGRNPDGIPHAYVDALSMNRAIVSFEDLRGGGDNDFNDAIIRVRQVPVPEPTSLALLGMMVLASGAAAYRGRRSRKVIL